MSTMFKTTIQSTDGHTNEVIVTTQQIENTYHGNPRHAIQVWIDRKPTRSTVLDTEVAGNLWSPIVKGYRKTKDDRYIIQSFNIEQDITDFLVAFEDAISS